MELFTSGRRVSGSATNVSFRLKVKEDIAYATNGAPGLTRSKKLLGAPGIATRSKEDHGPRVLKHEKNNTVGEVSCAGFPKLP